MNFVVSLRSEWLKSKRTASVYLTLIGAAIGPVVYLLNILLDKDEIKSLESDPLNSLFRMLSEMNGAAFFPFFIILICTLLPHIEYKANAWKQVFASPQSRANVFFAKFISVNILMLMFLAATHFFMLLAAVALHFMHPGLHLFEQPLNGSALIANAANAYVLLLALCTIQFWMGLHFKNFIVPIGIGIALWLIGTIMALQDNSTLVYYFPYSFHTLLVTEKFRPALVQVAGTSVVFAIVVLVFSFVDFKRKTLSK